MADMKKYLDTTALGTLVDQIKAEDAKVLDAAKKYADGLATNYDEAGSAATAEANAKAYTDELANGQVNTNKEAIATLNGDANTAGSVAKAVADSAASMQTKIDAVEDKVDANAEAIAAINNVDTGILAQAKKYTDDEVAAVQGEVDNLEAYVGTFTASEGVDTVVKYIDAKTANIASNDTVSALADRVTQAEKDIDAIEADYLKAADKTELEGKITAVETAVSTEKSRAEGIEAGLRTDINTVMGDYLKAADKTELQGNIDTVAGAVERLTNGVSADEIDGVNDLIQYVKDHGPEVTGMQGNIADNAAAIEGVTGRMTTAEGKITAVEGAVATKVEQSVYDAKIAELAGADTALAGRISTLEGKFGEGEGSVEDMIADAKAEAIEAAASDAAAKDEAVLAAAKKYADDEDAKIESRVEALEGASATHALKTDVEAVAGRVTTLEGDMAQAKLDIDAVEELAAANKTATEANAAAIALKAAQTDLDAAVGRITKNETDISGLNDAVALKAAQADLDAAIARIAKNETDIAANTSAINSFTPITSEEVQALFA